MWQICWWMWVVMPRNEQLCVLHYSYGWKQKTFPDPLNGDCASKVQLSRYFYSEVASLKRSKCLVRGSLIESAKTLGNWARCKVLHPMVGPKVHLYTLRGDCVSSHGLERSWCAEHEPAPQGYLNKWSSLVGLPWEDCGRQIKGSDAISIGLLGLWWFFFLFFWSPLPCSRVI